MAREKKIWVIVALALAVLVASSPKTFGAFSLGVRVGGYSTSGNVVYVAVTNPTGSTQNGTVRVTAVVNGVQVVGQGSYAVPAGASATVPVLMSGSPTTVISCGLIQDGSTPI